MPIPIALGALKALGSVGGTMLAKKGVEEVASTGIKGVAMQGAKFAAQGATVGSAAHLAQKHLKGDQAEQSPSAPGEPAPGEMAGMPAMPQAQYAGVVGQPGTMMQTGYMAPGMMPAAVGGAGFAAAGPQVVAEAPSSQEAAAPEKYAGTDDGFLKSAGKTAMAAVAGGIGGAALKHQDGAEGTGEILKGALAGAGTGAFTKMGYEAIQKDGAGIRAGVYTGVAGALGSTLQEGGPGKLTSAMMGFGGGTLSNFAHDKLEDAGKHKSADAVAGAGLGGALGYTITGDKSQSLLGAGLGGGASVGLGGMDRAGGAGAVLKGESSLLDALKGDTGSSAEAEVAADQADKSGPEMG